MRGAVPVSGDAVLVGDDKLTLVFTPAAPLQYGRDEGWAP